MKQYIADINQQYQTARAGEHSYRPALEALLKRLLPADCLPTNEPSRIECGAPDFIITRGGVPVSYIECKDLDDADLDGKRQHKEQFDRYKQALGTVVFTDYLDFHLYIGGAGPKTNDSLATRVMCVRIGEVVNGKIKLVKGCEDAFAQLISELASAQPQSCKTAQELAAIMAGKARLMANLMRNSELGMRNYDTAGDDARANDYSPLQAQYKAFKETLIKDLTPAQFADIYSQTLAYGLFAARLHYKPNMRTVRGGVFCRETAAFLIPPTNPLLQQVFLSIAGPQLDSRVAWVVDSLAEAFAATDAAALMNEYAARGEDPMVHFYEDFLSAYDPATRKQRGVWYTPPAVVRYIVRAADEALVKHFGLPKGLADCSLIRNSQCVMRNETAGVDTANNYSPLHGGDGAGNGGGYRVQILDPATGTGTFLVEVIRKIREKFAGQEGLWKTYAAKNLLPRLTGFEVLMASYAIAHLKVEQELAGVTTAAGQRTQIFLTNSLEEGGKLNPNMFSFRLAQEAKAANKVKNDGRVMVMLGNPPYNVSTANKNNWIESLLADYKKDLNERNIQPLSDDYIKFIRLGQEYIKRNGKGVLAYICNNSFLDGLIHRRMRESLLETFDDIYILNLHGNARRRETAPDGGKDETAPDGGKDENVFDIMAGVSINVFVKHNKDIRTKEHIETEETKGKCIGRVHYADLWGGRKEKYAFLEGHGLGDTAWVEVAPKAPQWFFVPKDFGLQKEYERGVKIDELFSYGGPGVETVRDKETIFFDEEEVRARREEFKTLSELQLLQKYNFKDSRNWILSKAMADLRTNPILADTILYRPFDVRHCLYTGKNRGIMGYPGYETMKHIIAGNNLVFIAKRGFDNAVSAPCFIANIIVSRRGWTCPGMQGAESLFPLWLAPDEGGLIGDERRANLRAEAVARFAAVIGREPAPEEILQYVYGVLYTPEYRERYNEFLKVDFPRIPLPNAECAGRAGAEKKRNAELSAAEFFEKTVALGRRLIDLHLLRFDDEPATTYPVDGDNVVGSVRFEEEINDGDAADDAAGCTRGFGCAAASRLDVAGRVYINERQYFGGVSREVWEYWIGGYQPMQKWLKDRRGRALEFEDIKHYMRVAHAIGETINVSFG